MQTMYPSVNTKMPFYALGQFDTSNFSARPFSRSNAVPDTSASLVERNKFSINSTFHDQHAAKPKNDLSEMKNKNLNNYLKPLVPYTNAEK